MIIYMKKKLVEVIEYTYPQDYKKYCNFFLTVDFKEKKSKSKYDFYKKFIIINSLSRPSSDIFISMLEKAAEHIDIIDALLSKDEKAIRDTTVLHINEFKKLTLDAYQKGYLKNISRS